MLLLPLVARSTVFRSVAKVDLTEMHGIVEHVFFTRGCNPFFRRGCAKERGNERVFSHVLFPVPAVRLARETPFAFVARRSVVRMVHHRIPDVLAFSTDQKKSFSCTRIDQGSIVESWDAEHPRTRLLSINILNKIDTIGALTDELRHLGKALIWLRPFSDRKPDETMFSTTVMVARKDTSCSYLNSVPKLISVFTIKINKELRRKMLVSLFAWLLSLSAAVSALGRPSCLVTHCISREASAHVTSVLSENEKTLGADVFHPGDPPKYLQRECEEYFNEHHQLNAFFFETCLSRFLLVSKWISSLILIWMPQ